MSAPVIKVENLAKQYRIGERESYKTIRETIVNITKAPFYRWNGSHKQSNVHQKKYETIWAIDNISFEVSTGEVIGIIGRNGAGKSTLLKILSKITEPTKGRVELRGRVGSLLEVGTGFNPELTGHENIYLYGAILGMDRYEVTRKFDQIVRFAEIEKFVDTPVKRYSSGMYMRLAFAVAAYLEPEILIVDEVLAVGDARFWTKSINRMRELNEQGMTILLVSHNMWLIQTFCTRGILLDKGKIQQEGKPLAIIEAYKNINEGFPAKDTIRQKNFYNKKQTKFNLFQVLPEGIWATEKEAFSDSGVKVVMETEVHEIKKIRFLIRITSPDGFSLFTVYSDLLTTPPNGKVKCEAVILHLMLLPGEYLIWAAVCSQDGEDEILAAENVPLFVKKNNEQAIKYSLFWNHANWRIEN